MQTAKRAEKAQVEKAIAERVNSITKQDIDAEVKRHWQWRSEAKFFAGTKFFFS